MNQRQVSFAALMLMLTVANVSQPGHYYTRASSTTLDGAAQTNGGTVWCYSGTCTWDAITTPGKYRIFMRVRAGHAANRTGGVKGKTSYQLTVDGRKIAFKYVPNTAVYHSDEANWAWIVGDVGKLSKGSHTLVFKSEWHFGRWEAFVLTSNSKFKPPKDLRTLKDTPLDLSLLNTDQQKWFQGYTVWKANIETNAPPTSTPKSSKSIQSLALEACRQEYTATAFNVTNWLNRPMLFRITRSDMENELTASSLPHSAITLRRAIPLPAPRKHKLADALPKLDEAGLLLVPAKQTRQVWCAVKTHALKPGTYHAPIKVDPLITAKRCKSQEIDLAVRVIDLKLPSKHPLGIFMFDYDTRRPGLGEDLKAHFVNWRHVCLIPHPAGANPTFGSLDRAVKKESAEGARHFYFEHWHFRTDKSWMKPENRKKWIEGTRKWAHHVNKVLGIPYKRFSLHIYDEVSGGGVGLFLKARQIVREADPKVQVTMTITSHITKTDFKKLDPAVEIWIPHMPLYKDKKSSFLIDMMEKTGKPIYPYLCAENKRFWTPQYYRMLSWQTYKYKSKGLFMWTYLAGKAWQGRTWDGGMVFAGNGSVVPSRRWELMRMGLQDWLLLDRAAKAGHRKTVDALVAAVVKEPENTKLFKESRQKLIKLLRNKR